MGGGKKYHPAATYLLDVQKHYSAESWNFFNTTTRLINFKESFAQDQEAASSVLEARQSNQRQRSKQIACRPPEY